MRECTGLKQRVSSSGPRTARHMHLIRPIHASAPAHCVCPTRDEYICVPSAAKGVSQTAKQWVHLQQQQLCHKPSPHLCPTLALTVPYTPPGLRSSCHMQAVPRMGLAGTLSSGTTMTLRPAQPPPPEPGTLIPSDRKGEGVGQPRC